MDRLVKENEQSEVNRNNMGMKVSGEKGETEGRKGPGCDDASGRVLLAVWLVLMNWLVLVFTHWTGSHSTVTTGPDNRH